MTNDSAASMAESLAFRYLLHALLEAPPDTRQEIAAWASVFGYLAPLAEQVTREIVQEGPVLHDLRAIHLEPAKDHPAFQELARLAAPLTEEEIITALMPLAPVMLPAAKDAFLELHTRWLISSERTEGDRTADEDLHDTSPHALLTALQEPSTTAPPLPALLRHAERSGGAAPFQGGSRTGDFHALLWGTGTGLAPGQVMVVQGPARQGRETLLDHAAVAAVEDRRPTLVVCPLEDPGRHLRKSLLPIWEGGASGQDLPGTWRAPWGGWFLEYLDVHPPAMELWDALTAYLSTCTRRIRATASHAPVIILHDAVALGGSPLHWSTLIATLRRAGAVTIIGCEQGPGISTPPQAPLVAWADQVITIEHPRDRVFPFHGTTSGAWTITAHRMARVSPPSV